MMKMMLFFVWRNGACYDAKLW